MIKRFFTRAVVQGARKNRILFFLFPFSILFRLCVGIRNFFYNTNILKDYDSAPNSIVISIGNITAGGTGKTPVVLKMASSLVNSGKKVAVISRGYKGRLSTKIDPVIVNTNVHTPEEVGDEPYMISKRLAMVDVVINQNRIRCAEKIANTADIILIDDGMQYRKLKRDVEVIVVDGLNPFGGGLFLPCGLLREEIRVLARADLLIVNGEISNKNLKILKHFYKFDYVQVKCIPNRVCYLDGTELLIKKQKKVGLFCGIGNPNRFLKTAVDEGFIIVCSLFVEDHDKIEQDEMEIFARKCKLLGAELLLCTEKDFVKYNQKDFCLFGLKIAMLQVEMQVIHGVEHWKSLIEKVLSIKKLR